MNPQLTHHCLLLAPTTVLEIANQACVDVTQQEASRNTFSSTNIMLKDGVEYSCAGVYVTTDEYANLAPLATQLGGHYFLLMERVEGVWAEVTSLDECMIENGITRPEIEEPF